MWIALLLRAWISIWVKPKSHESPRQSRLGRLRPIATDDTSTSPNLPLSKQGLTVLAVESNNHGFHIWPRAYNFVNSNRSPPKLN